MNTAQRDAEILAQYNAVGDVARLANQYGLSKTHIYSIIHAARIAGEVARASEYAQAAMTAGSVVYALPAKTLQTSAGADAIITALETAIRHAGNDLGVYIAIAVIPVEHVEGATPPEPLINPRGVAATLQARVVNASRKAGVAV